MNGDCEPFRIELFQQNKNGTVTMVKYCDVDPYHGRSRLVTFSSANPDNIANTRCFLKFSTAYEYVGTTVLVCSYNP
jgi:hypothetical protein